MINKPHKYMHKIPLVCVVQSKVNLRFNCADGSVSVGRAGVWVGGIHFQPPL